MLCYVVAFLGASILAIFGGTLLGLNFSETVPVETLNVLLLIQMFFCSIFPFLFSKVITKETKKSWRGVPVEKLNPKNVYEVLAFEETEKFKKEGYRYKIIFFLKMNSNTQKSFLIWEVDFSKLIKPNLSSYESIDDLPQFFQYEEVILTRASDKEDFIILDPLQIDAYENYFGKT